MTPLLAPALREMLIGGCCTFAWKDPNDPLVWYETDSYGESHLQKRGEQDQEGRSPVIPDETGHQAGPQVWLVQSIFCSPRSWWQHVAAHPDLTVVPVFFHRGRLVIGPGFMQHGPICPTCAALRLAQASPYPLLFKALLASPITCGAGSSLAPAWAALDQESVASFAIAHHDRLRSGGLISLSLTDEHAEVHWHHILPPPGDHPYHEIAPTSVHIFGVQDLPWSMSSRNEHVEGDLPLTDAFVGPLLATGSVPDQPGEPRGIAGAVTIAGHLGKFTRWHADVSGSGLSFSAEQARGASLGEAVERYSGNYIPPSRLIYATENALEHAGRPYVSLERFCPFTREQKATPTWPFATHTSDRCLPWVEASVLGEGQETTLLPAEAVFLGLARVTRQQSHIPVPLAGIAAHTSREAATTAALLEVIERDASMIWWHGGLPAKQLVGLPRALQEQVGQDVPQGIRQWYLLLSTDMPGFTVAGCLLDREHDVLVLGFATRTDLADALRKASAEAWQLRRLSLQFLNRDSDLWRDIDRGRLPMPTRPFRTDRRYAESFRTDYADMHQLSYNLQYFLDARTHVPALARLTADPCSFAEAEALQQVSPNDLIALCIARLAQRGEHLYRVDLTTPDMGQLGLVTLRIACPGLVGNTPTAFLPLGHPRFEEASRQGAQIYLAPMPHA